MNPALYYTAPTWQPNTVYALGERISNDNNTINPTCNGSKYDHWYQALQAGTSGSTAPPNGGPSNSCTCTALATCTGTALANCSDGSVVWGRVAIGPAHCSHGYCVSALRSFEGWVENDTGCDDNWLGSPPGTKGVCSSYVPASSTGQACTSSATCPQNHRCVAGVCTCNNGFGVNCNDSCQNGQCVKNTFVPSDDGNPCTIDSCDPVSGVVQHDAGNDGAACDDGDPCTENETCSSGACTDGTLVSCDDGVPCTTDSCIAGTGCAHDPAPSCLDHFLCYKAGAARAAKGSPPYAQFAPQLSIKVTDALSGAPPDQHLLDLTKVNSICNPVDKNGESPGAPAHTEHLERYKAAVTKTDPPQPKLVPFVKTIENQLGTLKLSVQKVQEVMVPSAKVVGDGGAPQLVAPAVNHFRCYKAKVAKAESGQPPFPQFTPVTVTLTDQFGGPLQYDLVKPALFCNPADKQDEDPSAPSDPDHLVCYKGKLSKTDPKQAKFVKTRVSTNNGFGSEVLDAEKVLELCVPSLSLD